MRKKSTINKHNISDKKIKIAVVVGRSDIGGVTSSVMNYLRLINKDKFNIHFYSYDNTFINPQIEALGFKSFSYPIVFRFFKSIHVLKKCFQKEHYDIVHVHMTSLSFVALLAAKLAGVPVRICHTHSTSNIKESKWIIKMLLKPLSKLFATHYVGCGKYACDWMYGKNFSNKYATIIKNAISFDRFDNHATIDIDSLRTKYHLQGRKIIGTIGRLEEQKNYKFLIDAFKILHHSNPEAALVIVGDGSLYNKLARFISKCNLNDSVFIFNEGINIVECYSMFDIFVLPSLFEGLPNVVIEAQIMGLPCLISDSITKECNITSRCKFIPITSKTMWAKEMNYMLDQPKYNELENINAAGYNIQSEVKNLEKYYEKCINEK